VKVKKYVIIVAIFGDGMSILKYLHLIW